MKHGKHQKDLREMLHRRAFLKKCACIVRESDFSPFHGLREEPEEGREELGEGEAACEAGALEHPLPLLLLLRPPTTFLLLFALFSSLSLSSLVKVMQPSEW